MTNNRATKDGAASLRTLFEQHSRAVRKHITAIVHRLDVAEELMQQAFLRLLLSDRAHFDSPKGLLFRTARNLALDHVRRARRVPMGCLDEQPAEYLADGAPSAEDRLAAREELAFMRAVLLELPPKCRQAFLLVRLEAMSQREAAIAMGISQTMVRKYLTRAILHIQVRTAGRL